jgi:hypothetical protein
VTGPEEAARLTNNGVGRTENVVLEEVSPLAEAVRTPEPALDSLRDVKA